MTETHTDRRIDKLIHIHTYIKTKIIHIHTYIKQTDKQTDRQTDRQTNR